MNEETGCIMAMNCDARMTCTIAEYSSAACKFFSAVVWTSSAAWLIIASFPEHERARCKTVGERL